MKTFTSKELTVLCYEAQKGALSALFFFMFILAGCHILFAITGAPAYMHQYGDRSLSIFASMFALYAAYLIYNKLWEWDQMEQSQENHWI